MFYEATGGATPPRRTRGWPLGGVEIAKAQAHPVVPELGGEAAGGARADAAVSPSFPATRRRGEKERGESGSEVKSGERAVARHKAVGGRWIL